MTRLLVLCSLLIGCGVDEQSAAPSAATAGTAGAPNAAVGGGAGRAGVDAGGQGGDDTTSPGGEGGALHTPAGQPGPGAFAPDFRDSRDFFTRMSEPMKGLPTSPHGFVQIFYSTNLEPLLDGDEFEAPEGSVAIKAQSEEDDGTVDAILVMVKGKRGFDPANNDWLYEVYRANGTLSQSGGSPLAFCHDCHQRWPDTAELGGTRLAN